MASFYIYEAASPVKEVAIPKMGRFQIGRNSRADLLLPDKSVSRRHAVVELVGDHYVIEDRGAINGMFVNGKKVDEHKLQPDDEVQIGCYLLVFREEGNTQFTQLTEGIKIAKYHVPSSLADNEAQTVMLQQADLTKLRDTIRAQDRAVIRVAGTNQAWRPGRERLSFGGKQGRIPVQANLGFGATYAEIKWTGTAHLISKTGTFVPVKVNGADVKEERALRDGDTIVVGKSEFQYVVR